MNRRTAWARRAVNLLFCLTLTTAAACSNSDPCADVSCDDGVCVDGQCTVACDGDDCRVPCATAVDCADGALCTNEGFCAEDLCADTACERGVCKMGTGVCVNAAVCTAADENTSCVEGSRCVAGTCEDQQTFCDELACDRGVCSFEALDCVNADDCAGDDALCADGYYCAGSECLANQCDADKTDCPRGTCDAATGECVSPDTCSASSQCVDGSLCVGGACVEASNACGEAGCAGNQNCEYDASGLSAACVESTEGCSAALDCLDGRQCVSGACVEPTPCAPDPYEPNDQRAEATDLLDVAVAGVVGNLSLCAGDVDTFSFDTFASPAQRGLLVVDVEIDRVDVGLGSLTVELIDKDQMVVDTVTTARAERTVRIKRDITFVNAGVYTVRVSGEDVAAAGVRYAVRAEILDPSLVAACEAAAVLNLSTPVAGNTLTSTNAGLTTSCLDPTGRVAEDIWTVEVAEEGVLTVQATPSANADVAISLRTLCEGMESELGGACVDAVAKALPERISVPVVPGDYVIVVESGEAGGGAYTLSAVLEPVICTAADNACIGADAANVCNRDGTAFDVLPCPYGCADGGCVRDPGDVCATATVVDVGRGFTGYIDWAQYAPDYDPGGQGCVPNNSVNSETDGADAVFEIDVPADEVLVAQLHAQSGVNGALYLTADCDDLAGQCLTAANRGRLDDETLIYRNLTGTTQKVFLIADNSVRSTVQTSSVIDISVEPFVCNPGSARCVLNRESQICNPAGTAYDSTVLCEFGCDNSTGACMQPLNDVCGGATPLVEGVPSQPQDLSALENDYDANTNGSCRVGAASPKPGADGTFLIQGVTAGDVVTVTLTADFNAVLWVADGCSNDAVGTCLAGADDTLTAAPEVLRFVAPRDGDFIVVAESASAWDGTFTVEYTVAAPVCTPNTTIGCNAALTAVDYCDGVGSPQAQRCDAAGCDAATGQCANPSGDVCADAIRVATTPGLASSGSETGTHSEVSVAALNPSAGVHGNCSFVTSPDEPEAFYAFELAVGDLLTIDFTSESPGGQGYLVEDCHRAESCQFNVTRTGERQYLARSATTVFFVVDHGFASSQHYSLDWSVTPSPSLACVPGARSCTDAFQLEICAPDGASATYEACPGGCSYLGGCVQSGANDTCGLAVDAGTGAHVVVYPEDYSSTIDDGCGLTTTGADAFFSVNLQPNDLLRVSGVPSDAYDDAVVYIFTDCADAKSSCLAGKQMDGNESRADAYYLATQAQTVFVGLDTDSASDDDPFYFEIEILTPQCSDADPLVCDSTGTAVQYCQNSLRQTYACDGPCQNGACASPRGDVCWDAFDLGAESSPLTRSWQTASPLVNPGPGVAGACAFDDFGAGHGQEHVYRVDLAAGDLLSVEETSSTPAVLYLLSDCTAPTSACLANDQGTERLSYFAEDAQTVFLAVDRTSTQTTSLDYTLEWSVTRGSLCAPGRPTCLDANTAAVCIDGVNSTGPYACANGCVDGACIEDASMDSCATAPVLSVGGGISLLYDASDFSDDASVACAGGTTTPGADLFFRVDLQPLDIVRARSFGIGNEVPVIYFFTDCADPESTCIAGARGSFATDHTAEIEHQATTVETIWVAIDSATTNDDELFQVQIDVLTPDCTPGQFQNVCNPSGTGFTYCDETGFTRNYLCGGSGVCDTTTNRCAEPAGEACIDPIEATPPTTGMAITFAGDFATLTNDHELPVANNCLPSWTPGADSAYVVDLEAGQTLTANLVSTLTGNEQDLALYLVGDCVDIDAWCLGGADAAGATATPETVTYTASTRESVTLIVDSFFANAFGTYRLDVTID